MNKGWFVNKTYADNDCISFGPMSFKVACKTAKDIYDNWTKAINISKQKKGRTL